VGQRVYRWRRWNRSGGGDFGVDRCERRAAYVLFCGTEVLGQRDGGFDQAVADGAGSGGARVFAAGVEVGGSAEGG